MAEPVIFTLTASTPDQELGWFDQEEGEWVFYALQKASPLFQSELEQIADKLKELNVNEIRNKE